MSRSPDSSSSSPTLSTREVIRSLPWYERALGAVAPSWAFTRLQARVQRHLFEYQAAQTDRIFAPKTYSPPAESSRTQRDRIVMMYEARDLVENFESAKTALGKFASFTVPTEWSANTGDERYDALVNDWFHNHWCRRADFTGRHSFRVLLELLTQMQPVDGDAGAIKRNTADGLRVQLVPGDLIGNPQQIVNSDTYFSGVIVDGYGRPLGYEVFRRSVEGVYGEGERVPAAHFCHYFNPFRVDQYRGVTEFHSVIRTARMIKETLEAERVAQRHKSQHAAIVFNERGAPPRREAFSQTPAVTLPNGETQLQEYSGVGTILYLSRGDKVETMPARPGEGFMDFVDYGDHLIARGLDIPYGVLFGTSGYKGPNVRAEFAQADRVFDRRRNLLCTQVADPIKDAAILDAISRGELPMPPVRAEDGDAATGAVRALQRACRGEWRFPAKPSIDAGRESTANLNENRQGIKSASQIAAEQGYDWDQTAEQLAKEAAKVRDLAKKYRVPETAIRLPTQMVPQTVAGAAVLGEGAGEAAAAAQQESVTRPAGAGESDGQGAGEGGQGQPPARRAAAPEAEDEDDDEAGDEQELSARVRLALQGPRARRGNRLESHIKRHTRLATVRRALGDHHADADRIRTTFERLAK